MNYRLIILIILLAFSVDLGDGQIGEATLCNGPPVQRQDGAPVITPSNAMVVIIPKFDKIDTIAQSETVYTATTIRPEKCVVAPPGFSFYLIGNGTGGLPLVF